MATTGEPKQKKPRKTRGKPGPKPGAKAAREAAAAAAANGDNGSAPAADPQKPARGLKPGNGDQSIKFKFELNDDVTITTTQIVGEVRGRVEHVNTRLPRYAVAYSDKTGSHHEDWIDEDQLQAAPSRPKRRATDK